MSTRLVARRYAKALHDSLDAQSLESATESLTALSTLYESATDLQQLLNSPAFTVEEKEAVLGTVCRRLRAPEKLGHFLSQLAHATRLGLLPQIAEAFAAILAAQRGSRTAYVTSAGPLDQASRDAIQRRLGGVLQGEVDLVFTTDPALVGGLHVRLGSTVFDGTVRGRLTTIKGLLTRE